MYRVRYNNGQGTLNSRQSVGSPSTMKIATSSVILSFFHSLLVQGHDPAVSKKDSTINPDRRILNGESALPADFRFLVRLHKGNTLCGGTVISNYFILTAAHCVAHIQCSAVKLFPSTWVEGMKEKIHAVQCYPHEYYDETRFWYDIALIRTGEDLLQDKEFEKIPLVTPGTYYPAGTPALISGWGKKEDRKYPGRLFRSSVLIEDWSTCDYKYKHAQAACKSDTDCPVPGIPRRGLCTQGQGSTPSGSCHGDSGGPVIVKGVLAGVIIGSILTNGECKIGTPSLHTSATDYLPWIYSITEPDKDTRQIPVADEYPASKRRTL